MASFVDCGKGKAKLSPVLTSNDINSRLPDELLQEILCRLPSSKFAFQCKPVCKRWASLVSNPFFIRRFIADKENTHLRVFSTLIDTDYSTQIWKCLTMTLRGTLLTPEKVSLLSLPILKEENDTFFRVLASCNDLVLISGTSKGSGIDYYICNAQTNQRLLLPGLPYYSDEVRCAITCDPYETILDATYRYCITVLTLESSKMGMKAYLFSNANKNYAGQWREILLSVPNCFKFLACSHPFVFNGKLHFDFTRCFLGFDLDDEDGNSSGVFKCHLLDCPSAAVSTSHHFQEYQSQLYMFLHHKNELQMWCLKDYKKSEWSLLHKIRMQDWIIRNEQFLDCTKNITVLIGTHPTNPNGVYAVYGGSVVVFDLSTRTFEMASDINIGEECDDNPFPSILPTWPTPLPTLN